MGLAKMALGEAGKGHGWLWQPPTTFLTTSKARLLENFTNLVPRSGLVHCDSLCVRYFIPERGYNALIFQRGRVR